MLLLRNHTRHTALRGHSILAVFPSNCNPPALYMAFADNMHQTITKTAEETGITYQTLYRFLDVFCGYLARLSLLFMDIVRKP